MSAVIREQPYETGIITEVKARTDGFEVTHDGWTIWIPCGDVTPHVGEAIEFFGEGLGRPVRGIRVAGNVAFYRTKEEYAIYADEKSYGKSAEELLDRWDAGGSVWSIGMGGFGPGYEQALQIAAFEMLRGLIQSGIEFDGDGSDEDKKRWETVAPLSEANGRIDMLGLSGAQYGAARNLAFRFYFNGPIETIKSVDRDRLIQVSANAPSVTALDAAVQAARAAISLAGEGSPNQRDTKE